MARAANYGAGGRPTPDTASIMEQLPRRVDAAVDEHLNKRCSEPLVIKPTLRPATADVEQVEELARRVAFEQRLQGSCRDVLESGAGNDKTIVREIGDHAVAISVGISHCDPAGF
jgi:hypothetical protein